MILFILHLTFQGTYHVFMSQTMLIKAKHAPKSIALNSLRVTALSCSRPCNNLEIKRTCVHYTLYRVTIHYWTRKLAPKVVESLNYNLSNAVLKDNANFELICVKFTNFSVIE